MLANIVRNAMRPGYFRTMAVKVLERLDGARRRARPEEVSAWCQSRGGDVGGFARSVNAAVWDEALAFGDELAELGKSKLTSLIVGLGGGGHYPLIYFLVRTSKPAVVVETGVAAGFSTVAILTAMQKNNRGHLYSSDFPYFRLEEPEKYIGYLVGEHLRDRWTLDIRGDRYALPRFCRSGPIDFFHYDSDKSYLGRRWAMRTVRPHLARNAICLIDDIDDNWHFRDHCPTGRVFRFEEKYVGLIS